LKALEQQMETSEKIREFVADERDKVAKTIKQFNKLNDEYKEGYWIAMNTVMRFIDDLQVRLTKMEKGK
jgi:hypothetical protein